MAGLDDDRLELLRKEFAMLVLGIVEHGSQEYDGEGDVKSAIAKQMTVGAEDEASAACTAILYLARALLKRARESA